MITLKYAAFEAQFNICFYFMETLRFFLAILTLCEKCPNTEFFLVRLQSKCGKIQTKKTSGFGHFSRSVNFDILIYAINFEICES